MAYKRVSQVEMATSFSKFYPCVAHKRVGQLSMAASLSKFFPLHFPQKDESSWSDHFLLKILPCAQKGESS